MKKLILIIMSLFIGICVQAQVKTIRGQLKLNDGRILFNQAFEVVGRNLSGKTDKDGYFTLSNVTDDDVILAIGWPEFKVPDVTISVISVTPAPVVSLLLDSDVDTIGVVHITNKIPNNQYFSSYDVNRIVSFKQDSWNNKMFRIKEANSYYRYKGIMVNYTSFVDVATVGKLPELQTEYAQGQGASWRGAELNEVFSWGPKISNLEYSGQTYPYDKNGALVSLGNGNGQKANIYDPTDFFRTGISFGNSMEIKFPGFRKGISTLSLGQRKNNSPIPNAYKEFYNASLMMDKVQTGRFTSSFGVLYKSSYSKLNEQGANLSTLLHSVLTTPPTFDNANGLSRKQAVNGSEAWLLDDNTQRAYAKDAANNPFMLINNLPDRNKSDNLLAYAKTQYEYERFKASALFSYDKQWDLRHNGIMANPFNHNTYRKQELSNIIASGDFTYQLSRNTPRVYLMANYGFKRTIDVLYREDILASQPQTHKNNANLSRNAHDIKYGIKINNYDNNTFEVFNKHYFSNTVKPSKYVNMFPEVGFNLDMEPIFDNAFNLYNVNLSLYGSSGRSIGEPSLIYNNPATLSTNLKSEDFRKFFEYTDIQYNDNLHPEIYFKNEIGARYRAFRGKLIGEFNWFMYNTRNFTSPVFDGTSYSLQNLGRLNNYGYFISLNYYERINHSTSFDVLLNFSQTWNKVSSVYVNEPFVRLSGFSDIATVFAENEPLGAIYGTSYLRNDKNQMVIGDDGFPVVDKNLKMIGDPTPDYKITLAPTFRWKQFTLGVMMEYSYGGDRWNGTRAMLDYHGVSAASAKDRNISDYVFEGVNMAGNQNTKPVDFYNTAKPISENKWVRYGTSGVGEEYIEKASYFRISEASVSYSLYNGNRAKLFKSIKLRLSAHNLLLLTKYKGVDPSSLLFGYSSGAGLDLFNQPSLRSYSFSLTFEL